MGQDSLCLLQNLPDICCQMLEPLVSIRLLGHVIGTDIDKHLARLQIQKQGMDMNKFIRVQAADASIVDDVVDTCLYSSDFTKWESSMRDEPVKSVSPLDKQPHLSTDNF